MHTQIYLSKYEIADCRPLLFVIHVNWSDWRLISYAYVWFGQIFTRDKNKLRLNLESHCIWQAILVDFVGWFFFCRAWSINEMCLYGQRWCVCVVKSYFIQLIGPNFLWSLFWQRNSLKSTLFSAQLITMKKRSFSRKLDPCYAEKKQTQDLRLSYNLYIWDVFPR